MIEVKISAKIQRYKSKLVFGSSVRQIIEIIETSAVGVPLGVLENRNILGDILPWLVIISVVPFYRLWISHVKKMLQEMHKKTVANVFYHIKNLMRLLL